MPQNIKTDCTGMSAISSLRDIKMRVLILLATVSCALAAPSGLEAYAAVPIPAVAIPAVIPTIPPGDIQAAAINAKVFAEDQARAAADRARELAEQAAENQEEKIEEVGDSAKEKTEEGFWSEEDKKWQALNAVQTAEAQIDGAVAKNADAIAKSAIIPPIVAFPSPIVAPFVFAPGIAAPVLKYLEKPAEKIEEKPEEKPIVKEAPKEEIKSAEPESKEPLKDLKSELPLGLPLFAQAAYPIVNYPIISPWLQPQLPLIPIPSVIAKSS